MIESIAEHALYSDLQPPIHFAVFFGLLAIAPVFLVLEILPSLPVFLDIAWFGCSDHWDLRVVFFVRTQILAISIFFARLEVGDWNWIEVHDLRTIYTRAEKKFPIDISSPLPMAEIWHLVLLVFVSRLC